MILQFSILSVVAAILQIDFENTNSANSRHLNQRLLSKRSLTNNTIQPFINVSLTASYNFYIGTIKLGSPAQEVQVLLDTGSPVSWVYGDEGSFNTAKKFYRNLSSTFQPQNVSFSAEYGSGLYLGFWGTDLISAPQFISSDTIRNSSLSRSTSVPFKFGVITSFSTAAGAPGLLGLGPHIDRPGMKDYLNLPEAYAKYNVTSSPAFSIILERSSGRFLFDGVDLRYVKLPLYRFQAKKIAVVSPSSSIQSSTNNWIMFLDSMNLNDGSDYLIRSNVILDTGSPVTLLPNDFVDRVGKSLGLIKYNKYETYYINNTAQAILPTGTLTFNFNGLKINANISDFLVPGEYVWMDDGPSNVTALALMGSPNCLLGDSFFRNTYTILDPSSGDVILGQRTNLSLNTTNQGSSNGSNSTAIITFPELLKNHSMVINGTATKITTQSQVYHEASIGSWSC